MAEGACPRDRRPSDRGDDSACGGYGAHRAAATVGALSVPSNIAEGAGKGGDAEFRPYLQIAMGSASETAYHLRVARDLGFIETAICDDLTSRVAEVRRMATGLLKRIANRSPPTGH